MSGPTRYRRVRRGLPFMLAPFVLVGMLGASTDVFGVDTQPLVLAAVAVLTVVGALAIVVPAEEREAWAWLAGCLRRRPEWIRRAVVLCTALVVLALGLAEIDHRPLSGSWAAVAFGMSLTCYALGLAVLEVSLYVHPRRGWLALAVGIGTIAWPIGTVLLLPELDNHVFVVVVLAIALLPPPVVWGVVGLRRWRRRRAAGAVAAPTWRRALSAPPAITWRGGCQLTRTVLLVLSGLLLLVAALRVPIERKFTETSEIGSPPWRGLTPPADMAAAIRRYSPVLRLDSGELWPERSVSRFLSHSHAQTPGKSCFDPTPDHPDPPTCPTIRTIEDDADGSFGMVAHPKTGGLYKGAVAYPLVSILTAAERQELPPALRATTRSIIEYWLFYNFDQWHAPTALGSIRQSHEADWEFVGVGLNAVRIPTFVSYSEHCHGIWRPWSEAPVAAVSGGALRIGVAHTATHPLVVVARGSHANYPTTGTREPDWAGCPVHVAPMSAALDLVGFAANAREATSDDGAIEIPSVRRGLDARDSTGLAPGDRCKVASGQAYAVRPICRRIFWGNFETFRLGAAIGMSDMDLIPPDTVGPASPAVQKPGLYPAETIGSWPEDPNIG